MKAETRLFFMTLFVFLISVYFAGAQDSITTLKLTFDQAWEQTSRNSHVMKQVQYLQQEKDMEAKATKGLYMPKVGISAVYMFMSDDLTLDLTPVKNTITPIYSALGNYGVFSGVPNPAAPTTVLPDNMSTQAVRSQFKDGLQQIESADWNKMIQKKQFGTVAATFQWPIFLGGKIGVANKVAKIEQKETGEIARQKEGELISELTERYYGLCLAKQAICVRLDVFNGMDAHLHDAEKLQKEGLIANADVLHARLYHAQAERELTKSRRTAGILNQALNNTMAMEKEASIEPISELFYLNSVDSLQYFKSTAATKNPLLMQVKNKKLMVEQNYKAEKADYLPQVALQGMHNIVNKDLSPYTPTWMLGVGMKWTLFDGASRWRKVKSAYYKINQVEEIKLKAESDISTMVEKLYNELSMYSEQLKELESAKTFAEEYLRVREKAFHEEMTNATDVVDANLGLAQVRIERLQAMYGYDLTLAKLLQYSGIPEEFSNYRKRKDAKMESYKSEK